MRQNSTVAELKKAFDTTGALLSYFSFHHLRDVRRQKELQTLKDCVKNPYPTLMDIKQSHGYECAVLVAEVFVVNLNDSLKVNRMEEPELITEVAELIFDECPQIKLTELHEFFRRVKSAYYGEYYGSIDCVKLMSDFREFLRDRTDATKRLQEEREKVIARQRESEKEQARKEGRLISYPEYLKQKTVSENEIY